MVKLYSATLVGCQPKILGIELESVQGLPKLCLVGVKGRGVQDSRERILAALKTCGYKAKAQRCIVNFSPHCHVREDTHFELALALMLLINQHALPCLTKKTLVIGQLGLNGTIKSVSSVFSITQQAAKLGFEQIILPRKNYSQASLVTGLKIVPLANLSELIKWQRGQVSLESLTSLAKDNEIPSSKKKDYLLKKITGFTQAKRALIIAAAGHHHLLMTYSPEIDFLIIAKAGADLARDLTAEKQQQVHEIHGKWTSFAPPIRIPPANITQANFYGHQRNLSPGEASLAHHGVMILPDLTNFFHSVRGGLPQLLAKKHIELSNAQQRCIFPADFWLIAGVHPCACGYYGSHTHKCTCNPDQRKKFYVKYLSQLLPFFDLCLDLTQETDLDDFFSADMSALNIEKSLTNAEEMQQQRGKNNSDLTLAELKQDLAQDKSLFDYLCQVQSQLNLSLIQINKILKIARTIADLSLEEKMSLEHIQEALSFRWRNSFK